MADPTVPNSKGIFINLGKRIDEIFDSFAVEVIQNLVPELLKIIAPCLLLYFLIKGWLIMSGRTQGAISDLIMQVGMMSFLIAIGLSTTQTFRYAQDAFNTIQSVFLSALPRMPDSNGVSQDLSKLDTWFWLQGLWDYMFQGFSNAFDIIWDELEWSDIGYALLLAIVAVCGIGAGCFFLFSISSIFLINKVIITLLIAFSPVFFALGLFPVTRDYLINWAKTASVYLLSMVLLLTVGWMSSSIFEFYVKDIYDLATAVEDDLIDDEMSGLMAAFVEVSAAIVLMLAILSYVIRLLPSLASSLTGKFMGATAFTTSGNIMDDVQKEVNKLKSAFSTNPSESKSDGKQTDQKAQNIADQANSGGSAGLKKAASLAGGGRKGGKGQSGGKQRAQSANNHSKSNGFTQAAPLSAFAKGRGGSAQFSSNGANSGPAQSIPVRGDSSLSAGAGSSASKASGNSGASASYSAPASASQFSPNTANPKTSMTSNGGDKAMGASGSVSGYDLNAGSGTNLSQSAPVKAANLASAPSSPNGDASNGSPSGSTPSAPSDATKAANAATPIQASGGSIYSTKSAQAAQQAKAPGQGGIQSDGLGSATIQNNGLQQLKKAQRQSHAVNAANQAGQTPKKR